MAENSHQKDDSLMNDQNPSLSSFVDNMALVHEMAIDKRFKLSEEPSNTLKGQIKQIVHRAFWDHLEEELNKEQPNYEPAIKLIAELKETLLSVLFDHNVKLREEINNIIDVDLIKQQSIQGVVDIQGYGSYIINVMSKICTPERDEEINKLKDIEGLVPLFREIFGVLDKMKMDMANFYLTQIRPQFMQQSVELEQSKFREYLRKNPKGLMSTTKWLKQSLDVLNQRRNETSDTEANFDVSECVKLGFINIVLGGGDEPYPETLLMDTQRMAVLRNWIQCLMRLASVLVLTFTMVDEHLVTDAEYKRILKENILLLLKANQENKFQNVFPNIAEQIIKDTNSILTKRDLTPLSENNANILKAQINNLSDDKHTIRLLIRKRVENFLLTRLLSSDNVSTPCPTAFLEIETELNEFTTPFKHIVSHNFMVFEPFYEGVMRDLA